MGNGKARVSVPTVYLESHRGGSFFRVVRTRNVISPKVGDNLNPDQVQTLIDESKTDVIIDRMRDRSETRAHTRKGGER